MKKRKIIGYDPITYRPCYEGDPPRKSHCDNCGKYSLTLHSDNQGVKMIGDFCFSCHNRRVWQDLTEDMSEQELKDFTSSLAREH